MKITKPIFKPKKFGRLPGIPSTLLKLAISDFEKALEAGYTVDMGYWVSQKEGSCSVCLAGSVMVGRLAIDPAYVGALSAALPQEYCALLAIDHLRVGEIAEAFSNLDLDLPMNMIRRVVVVDYKDNPKKFKSQMKALATALDKEGY